MARLAPAQIERVRQILEPLAPKAVYLFGSWGTPRQHPHSDVDFAYLPTRTADPLETLDFAGELGDEFGCPADLVNLREASTVLRKEVFAGGELLFHTDANAVAWFEMLALSDYARLNEERHACLRS